MSEGHATSTAPAALRAAIARDLAPVRPLATPIARSALLVPLALLLLCAAPLTFNFRVDLARLGWAIGWGASSLQIVLGLALVAAAMREAIPGRAWSRAGLAMWLAGVTIVLATVTIAAWSVSPVHLGRGWWTVSGLCLMGSVSSALPVVVLGSVLAARAWPTRPAVAGLLIGLGAGLMSDAGWRLFCHFSEPSHVVAGHLAGIVVAGAIGAWSTPRLGRV